MTWTPGPARLLTRWGRSVRPENAWQEYPRPQLRRAEWQNLNGLWEYLVTPKRVDQVEQITALPAEGRILVPYPIESALSGVGRRLTGRQRLWYRREFTLPDSWQGRRVLLNFGAVDWLARVWVNGREAGMHHGGYLPFTFDITEQVRPGRNTLVVSAWDPSERGPQPRGKQSLKPRWIWYSAVSGIWQTVWLEPVPQVYISRLRILPDLDAGAVTVLAELSGGAPHLSEVQARVLENGRLVSAGRAARADEGICLRIPRPEPWSPRSPHLYDLEVSAGEDRVQAYFGLRKLSLDRDRQGRTRLCLNNQPLFQLGPLDQGYWPDGLYTPPSEQAVRSELEMIKGLGFNMLRKHVKVEPARYYYECDRLGLIVWQDMPNGGRALGMAGALAASARTASRPGWRDRAREWGRATRPGFLLELEELVNALENHPCIGCWVPFNEGWGQFAARQVAEWLRGRDPSRWVDHASGWFDQGAGDMKSMHVYFRPLPARCREEKRAWVLSEIGGYSLNIPGHLWSSRSDSVYRRFSSREDLTGAYLDLLGGELRACREAGLSAAVYTQATDVENETNGFFTYDREVEKMEFDRLREIHTALIESEEVGS